MFHRIFAAAFIISGLATAPEAGAQVLQVLNEKDNSTVVSAHITLRQLSDGKVQTLLTDADGKAKIPDGVITYPVALQVNSLGYAVVYDTLNAAESKTYSLSTTKISINEVVITGQYAPDIAANTVHTIKVINRKKIDMMAAQNLRDVLSNEMNIRLGQDNILGSSMSMQGISGQNVKILIDGVPVIGRLNGNIDISQINLNQIDHIEIVEGPLSVNFGTDALAGTINLISKKGQAYPSNIAAGAYYESTGQYNVSASGGYSKNKNTVRLNFGRNYFDGWTEGDKPFKYEKERPADSGRVQTWKPKEQYFGGLNYQTIIRDITFNLNSDVFDEEIINLGMPNFNTGMANDDTYKTLRFNNSLSATGKISNRLRLNFLAGYNYYQRKKNTYRKDITTLEQTLSGTEGDQDTTVFRTFMSRAAIAYVNPDSKINFEAGYDLNHEIMVGNKILDGKQTIGDYAVFATAEYKPWERMTIRPGLRVAYNTQYDAPLIPSLNVRYSIPLAADENARSITLRASYARGFRAPSIKDMYFTFVDNNHNIVGNTDLKAEYSNNFILNGVWQNVWDQKILKVELNNFYNRIENMIVLANLPTGPTFYTYVNAGLFTTFGSTMNAELGFNHFKFTLGAGYVAFSNDMPAETGADKFSLTPELKSTMLFELKQYDVSLGLFYKYTGKTPSFSLNANEELVRNIQQDFSIFDVSLNKGFSQGRYKVGLGCKNIFNVTTLNNTAGATSSNPHGGGSLTLPYSNGRLYFVKLDINLNFR